MKYFDWVADQFDLRRHIQFETEVKALTWDEAAGEWQIDIEGPDGGPNDPLARGDHVRRFSQPAEHPQYRRRAERSPAPRGTRRGGRRTST